MRQNKITSVVSTVIILSIILVTAICVNTFKDSSTFLSLFTLLFVSSAVISTIWTRTQSKIVRPNPDLREDNLGPTVSFPGPEKVYEEPCPIPDKSVRPYPDLRVDDLGSIFSFPEIEEVYGESCLSLDKYLELNDFKLKAEVIDAIEWKRFELLCHLILKASGFNSRLTENGADEGVDIRVFDNNDENKTLCLFQCKKWRKSRKVDRPLLQQLKGQMAAEKVEKGGYCVTSSFTVPAQEFAATNNIELFDQDKITNSFNKLSDTVRGTILKELLKGDYWTPSCASCGQKFKKKKLKNGKIVWGCNNSHKHGWSSIQYYEAAPIENVH